MLVAFFALPVLTKELGADRFGVLTLAWVILGYFSLFDLGLGRAMTKLVAEKVGLGEENEVPTLVWNSLALMLVVGLIGCLVAAALSPWLVRDALRIPAALRHETLSSFYLLSLSIPLVTSTAGLRGVLEAKQRFDLVNMLRIPLGAFTFLAPVAVLPFSHSLLAIVWVLVVGRILGWIAHLLMCFHLVPALRACPDFRISTVKPLLRFGTWISVSNIISPLMVTLDRFVIGAMISVSAVAYYTAPYEVVTKLWIITGALTGVLFPAFAAARAREDDRAAHLLRQGIKFTFLALFPVILIVVTLSHEALSLWLGREYAQNSTSVLQWLAIGVFINSFAQIPFAMIQAAGRPDLTAKFHLLELPFYLVVLPPLISRYGIEGAAMAWTLRAAVDTTLLFISVRRFFRPELLPPGRFVSVGVVALSTAAVGAALPMGWLTKLVFLFTVMTLFMIVGWYRVLATEDRSRLRRWAASARSAIAGGAG